MPAAWIDNKRAALYTIDPDDRKKVDIGVVCEAGTNPYLRTYADGDWNNLLAQQQCGANCRVVA